MIKSKNGKTVFSGGFKETLMDLCAIIDAFNNISKRNGVSDETIKHAVDFAVENGFLTEEELKAKAEELLRKKNAGGDSVGEEN